MIVSAGFSAALDGRKLASASGTSGGAPVFIVTPSVFPSIETCPSGSSESSAPK
jgi:hypothetical protein